MSIAVQGKREMHVSSWNDILMSVCFFYQSTYPLRVFLTTDQKTMAKDAHVCTVRRRWQILYDAHSSYKDHLKKIMILFSSSLYNDFVNKIHSSTSEICSIIGTADQVKKIVMMFTFILVEQLCFICTTNILEYNNCKTINRISFHKK